MADENKQQVCVSNVREGEVMVGFAACERAESMQSKNDDILIHLGTREWDRRLRWHQATITDAKKGKLESVYGNDAKQGRKPELTHPELPRYRIVSAPGHPLGDAPNVAGSQDIPTALAKHLPDLTISPGQMSPNPKTSAVRDLRTGEGRGMVEGSSAVRDWLAW